MGEEFEGREDEEVEIGHAEEGTQAEDGHAVDQSVSKVKISEFQNSQQHGKYHKHDAASHNHALPSDNPRTQICKISYLHAGTNAHSWNPEIHAISSESSTSKAEP